MLKIGWVCLALVAIVASLAEAKTHLIDIDGADVESIAQVVCSVKKGTSKQIGRGSTIAKLASFFGGLPSDHKLSACGAKYAKSIERLADILATNNDNVCDDLKLADIEEFHRDYVSRLPKHVESRKSNQLNIPKIIKLFFMHYATEVSSICARDTLKQMETFKFNSGDDQTDVPKIDSALNKFQEYTGLNNLNPGYSEIFLPWLLVDGLPLEKYTKAASYLVLKGDKKLFIKIKEAVKLLKVQTMCSHLLKPIYSRVLLPVIRLISLGYYPPSQELAEQLAQESPLKRLYVSTQLCETILPVQVYADGSLADDEIIMISPEDAAGMTPATVEAAEPLDGAQFGLAVPQNSMLNGFNLENNKAFGSINEIKGNVVSRGKGLLKVLKLISNFASGQMKSKLKKVLMKRGNKQEALEPPALDETKMDEDASELARKYSIDEEEEDGEEAAEGQKGLVRTRRSLSQPDPISDCFRFMWSVIKFCAGPVVIALLTIIAIIKIFIVGGLEIIYRIFRYITGYAIGDVETAIEFLWNAGKSYWEQGRSITWNAKKSNRKVKYIGPHKRRTYDVHDKLNAFHQVK